MAQASTPDPAQQQRPRVDVAVVTWNTAQVTPRALRALLDSDQGCHLRVLVRDNASSDGTVDAIAREVPEAVIDAGRENRGFAAGVNSIIARSDAPWIFLLNPDAWPLPGAVNQLVLSAQTHPRAAAVAPRLEHPDGTLQHSTHPFPSLRVAATVAFAWNRISPQRADELFLEGAWAHDRTRRIDWAHGAALLIRREALDEIGGLEERFFMYAEDLEWCWRAHTKGWEIWFEPEAVVQHIANVSGAKRFGTLRTQAHIRSSFNFYQQAHGTPAALCWSGVNAAGAAARTMGALRRGERDRARYWWSYLAATITAPFRGPTG